MKFLNKILAASLNLAFCFCAGADPVAPEELTIACHNHFTSFFRDFPRPPEASFSVRKMPSGEIRKALEKGTLKLALTDLPPADTGRFSIVPLAVAGQLIAVHRENTMKDISLHDAHELLSGNIADWKQLDGARGPLRLYRTADQKPRPVFFCGACRGHGGESGKDAKKTDAKKTPVVFQTSGPSKSMILLFVDPDGAAELPLTSYNEDRVKLLSVNGIAPTLANLDQGRYPLASKIYLVHAKQLSPLERKLVDYIRSRDFARLLYSDGCLPLKQDTESRK